MPPKEARTRHQPFDPVTRVEMLEYYARHCPKLTRDYIKWLEKYHHLSYADTRFYEWANGPKQWNDYLTLYKHT